MNIQEYLLTVVSEECVEVSQRCSKALRFGMDEVQREQTLNNRDRILQEFNDLVASMELLYDRPISEIVNSYQVQAKKQKINKYLKYSMDLGIVTLKQQS